MNIDTLAEIKELSSEALKARKSLEKLHSAYMLNIKNGGMTRLKTTTYNARTADIMINRVKPCEDRLKEIFK